MGGAAGEAITRAAELALETRTPLLVISASGGARMQEGGVSLMQMVKTSQAVARLGEEGVLYISLLTDPTYGGVSASFATLGDVLIAEPGAHIGFAGPAVIEQTIRQKLPDGLPDRRLPVRARHARPRRAAREPARGCCAACSSSTRAPRLPRRETAPQVERLPRDRGTRRRSTDADSAAGARSLGRRPARPQDRAPAHARLRRARLRRLRGAARRPPVREDAAIVGGLARLGELTVMADRPSEGPHDGRDDGAQLRHAQPEGYRKALRLMHYAARFGLPIVTLVDTPGAYPGPRRRGARAIGRDRRVDPADVAAAGPDRQRGHRRGRQRRRAGAGGGRPGADAGELLLLGDQPRGLRDDPVQGRAAAPRAAAALRMTGARPAAARHRRRRRARARGGAHTDPVATAANLKTAIVDDLRELLALSTEDLLAQRYERFRVFGAPGRPAGTADRGDAPGESS